MSYSFSNLNVKVTVSNAGWSSRGSPHQKQNLLAAFMPYCHGTLENQMKDISEVSDHRSTQASRFVCFHTGAWRSTNIAAASSTRLISAHSRSYLSPAGILNLPRTTNHHSGFSAAF